MEYERGEGSGQGTGDHMSDTKNDGAAGALDAALRPPFWMRLLALAVGLFGLLTLVSGGRVLFRPEEARVAAGAYMPFVVWFNFLAGFAYVLAALAVWQGRRWACALAAGIATATVVVFAIFGFKVLIGTPFEMRTVGAMTLRSGFWVLGAYFICRRHSRMRGSN